MSSEHDAVLRAFHGEGPIYEAMLDERARELAVPSEAEDQRSARAGRVDVLAMAGRCGRWALPIDSVARVAALPRWVRTPGLPPALLGLAMVDGRRCLVADLDSLVADIAPRPADRPGHAVMLRHAAFAVVVDRADGLASVPATAITGTGGIRMALLPDGMVLLDPLQLAARAKVGGSG